VSVAKLQAVRGGGQRYPLEGDSWEKELLWKSTVGRDGQIVRTLEAGLSNVYAILRNAPEWEGVVVYNDARGEVQFVAPPPFVEVEPGAWTPERLSLATRVKTVIWLERVWHLKTNSKAVGEALEAIAASRKINPVQGYLKGLRWDGVPRLDTWLVRYCGTKDTPYTRGVGAAWLRQGVARALHPGCPFFGMLVLEGLQGRGKSTVFSILGGDYFTDDVVDLHNKDAVAQVRRSWIVELPELAAMRRSDLEATKAFLTRRTDNQRLAYREDPEMMARRCIFGGSTNADVWLVDVSGNRRFWPVKVGLIDLEALRRDRDQLWAEAMATWSAGAAANLEEHLWAEAAEEQGDRTMDDVWEGAVSRFIANKAQTSAEDVLVDAIGLKLEQITQRERLRIGDVLRRLGWGRRQIRVKRDGKDAREWVFLPLSPDTPSPDGLSPTPPVTSDNPGKSSVVTSVTSPGSRTPFQHSKASSQNPLSSTTGDTGDTGDNREILGGSAVTNPVTNPPVTALTGDKAAAWDARYHEHLAARPGAIGAALAATTAELGPRPEDVPDV
jgi:predicted P-loop ATPase